METNAFLNLEERPGLNLWSSFTFWTQRLTAFCPAITLPTDTIARYRGEIWYAGTRYLNHHWRSLAKQEKGEEIQMASQMAPFSLYGALLLTRAHSLCIKLKVSFDTLNPCQEKVPGLVRRTNQSWQGSDSLDTVDRFGAGPSWHIASFLRNTVQVYSSDQLHTCGSTSTSPNTTLLSEYILTLLFFAGNVSWMNKTKQFPRALSCRG